MCLFGHCHITYSETEILKHENVNDADSEIGQDYAMLGDEKTEPPEEENINNEDALKKEGYLKQKATYFPQYKQRFIILRENHLFIYTDHNKSKITELIKLSSFQKAQSSSKPGQFELIPKNEKEWSRIFAAASKVMDDTADWVKIINESLS